MARKWGKRRHYHKRSPFQLKLKKQTVYTVGAIWLWLFAGTVTLAFFGEGTVLANLREQLTYHIGWVMYGLPPFLVTLSFLFFKIKSDIGRPNVPFGLGIALISLLGVTQAGVLGGSLWNIVASNVSAEGALLVYLAILVIGLMILFNASLDRIVNFILIGGQVIFEAIANFFGNMGRKSEKPLFGQEKLPMKIGGMSDEKPLIKSPMIPPPVPAKGATAVAVTKTDLKINSTMSNEPNDMAMWEYPPLSLLSDGPGQKADRGDTKRNANIIESTLDSFGITAKVREVNTGPAVTQYAIEIASGTKVNKITSLSSDMALALAAPTGQVRIEAPIPGRNLIGIEIPNRGLEFVTLKRMLGSDVMRKAKSKLAVAVGLDVSGNPIIADIGRMPHVLVAGTTGSGKSVLINSWIASLPLSPKRK